MTEITNRELWELLKKIECDIRRLSLRFENQERRLERVLQQIHELHLRVISK